ncbi:radical SAM family heme chaperone HemW [uncultured Clostridium sp.]|uniref:radical SAM family heme chaperone HemW n=1 Tax=uncultured Clostridium sp. TaxID=59620 RepID=UPI0026262883|nr:radical SAM family heme chaperone HemW [uncultured Clostridium sp.]
MKNISLYIHIPFCDQKCHYCDFPSFAGKGDLKDRYIDALNKEINQNIEGYIINTIFVGGGTPSSLSAEQLERLLSNVKNFNFASDIEFTVECNPGSITREKLEVMKKYGVNRLSMGLQAVQNTLLKDLGRIHSYEVFKENFELARECGFNNINVDLMFGLPKQKVSEWKESLEMICTLSPEHISAYSLIIEEGTRFNKLYEADKLKLPNEEDEREMYHLAKRTLLGNGFTQYEISNYSKKDLECRHNVAYWKMENWLGVGSAASSYMNGERFTNFSKIETYIEKIENGESQREEDTVNTIEENIEEFMFMGLRLIEGISEDEFEIRFKRTVDSMYKDIMKKFVSQNLLVRENRRIYLTEKGIEYSNMVMSEMLL